MRALPAAFTLILLSTMATSSFAADATKSESTEAKPAAEKSAEGTANGTDMMDWFQEQRKGTVERTLKDQEHYRDRWPAHVKERYNITVKNADNTPTPYDPDATGGMQQPKMQNFTAPAPEPEPETVSTPSTDMPYGANTPEGPVEISSSPEENTEPKTGWPSETAPK